MSVRIKIKERLDELEAGLRAGGHLAGADEQAEMAALLKSVSKFFTVLDDSERDCVNSARIAITEKMPWS